MCHILLQDPKFFQLLLRIDIDLAAQTLAGKCPCGGVLHKADYPRKPRGCPIEVRADYASRFSFCCSRCRKRSTAMSVRFLGRRVYLSLVVVLLSARRAGPTATAAQLCKTLAVPARTILRWRTWWVQLFPATPLWQANCARFMPPVATTELPVSLTERFTGPAAESMMRLLAFLTPLTVRQ
ncbi:MAG: hypothetical protein GZ093_18910 [Rhodoferax sp.]|nr:hypothetical protein [Rhodoferax sp.]